MTENKNTLEILNLENINHEELLKAYMYKLSMKESQKKYVLNNKEKVNEIRRRSYLKKKRDPEFMIKQNERSKQYYHNKKKMETLEIL